MQLGQELAERGITASSYPQTDVRTIPASARLRDAIVPMMMALDRLENRPKPVKLLGCL